MINTIDIAMISHVSEGIPMDMTRVFARFAIEYAIDTRKHILGLGPFIARIARLLGIDIVSATLTMVSTFIAPIGLTTLPNMRIDTQVKGRCILADAVVPPQQPPLPPMQPQPEPLDA